MITDATKITTLKCTPLNIQISGEALVAGARVTITMNIEPVNSVPLKNSETWAEQGQAALMKAVDHLNEACKV